MRWTNLCLHNANPVLNLPRQWDLLISTGGNNLHDIIKVAQIITIERPRVDVVLYWAAVDTVSPCQAHPQGVVAVPE